MISQTEENYLKAIFKLSEKEESTIGTNALAAAMQTSAASVTDMVKRLADKKFIAYEKYKGVSLTPNGTGAATLLIRKHRLWEVFLVEKLGFAWDEVHDMAEELEHIPGEKLIEKLDKFLDYPKFDPHGDPIPDAEGRWSFREQVTLASLMPGEKAFVTGVDDHSPAFLQYLDKMRLCLGASIELKERFAYDNSLQIINADAQILVISEKVGKNLLVMTNKK